MTEALAAGEGEAELQLTCPVCSSHAFLDFNGRANARCAKCRSMERTRLLWMILKRMEMFRPGLRVLHLAPELALAKRYAELSGDRYHPCDIDPARYSSSFAKVRPLDLCKDLVKLPSRSFDLIIHSHVLEHLACDVEAVLGELERILAPGGHHFLSVPVRGETTREDLSEDLTPAYRATHFGQDDHYRIFGAADLPQILGRAWNEADVRPVEPLELFTPEQLSAAAVPQAAWTGISSHSIFHHVRPSVMSAERRARADPPPAPRPPRAEAAGPRLLLHIGMPKTGTSTLQSWLFANHEAVKARGLDSWSKAENHSELLFRAFAHDRRLARGSMWFQKGAGGLGNAAVDVQADRAAIRGRFEAFVAGLGQNTGLVSAEALWSFQPDEVRALGAYLKGIGVQATVLCWVRAPAEYFASAAQQRAKSGLTLAGINELRGEIVLQYRRLETWIEAFGAESLIVRRHGADVMADFAAVLAAFGIDIDVDPDAAPMLNQSMSLNTVRAMLALNDWRAARGDRSMEAISPALLAALRQLRGGRFVLPDFVARRMQPLFKAETDYLKSRFGDQADFSGEEAASTDDGAFLTWSHEEVGELLGLISASTAGPRKPGP